MCYNSIDNRIFSLHSKLFLTSIEMFFMVPKEVSDCCKYVEPLRRLKVVTG